MKILMGLMFLISLSFGDFDTLQFDESCNIVGAGTENKQLIFKGKFNTTFNECQSIVPAKIFFAKYSSCSIGEGTECRFGYYDGNIARSQISFGKGNDVYCSFICPLKQ